MARTGSYSILTTSGAILVSLVALISPTLTLGDVGRAEESLPIDTDLVILDTNSHYYSLWSDDSCHYIDDYYYLLAYDFLKILAFSESVGIIDSYTYFFLLSFQIWLSCNKCGPTH